MKPDTLLLTTALFLSTIVSPEAASPKTTPSTGLDQMQQQNGTPIYDPETDPIPYNADAVRHGPNYEIPPEPWKVEADKRIDTYRKANLNIRVVDAKGKPVKDLPVRIELLRHEFYWGAIVNGQFLNEAHDKTLQSYFLKYFNSAGSSDGLKPKQCPIPPCQKTPRSRLHDMAENQIEWFGRHNIPVRGHALVWEGKDFLALDLQEILNDPALSDVEKGNRIFKRKAAHLDHAVEKWDVFCWDVVNEPRVNHVVNDLLPEKNTFVEWFRLAAEARKKYGRQIELYYNENQIVSFVRKDATFEEHRDIYRAHIREIIDAGIPIDGIGFQYRFRRHVSPEVAYQRLCEFDDLGLPYQATEFEIKPMTEKDTFSVSQKKQMTAELLTVFFSHPQATGLWHWSFMDSKSGRSPDALFSYEGEPRPEAEQWIKMMEEDFNTDESLTTDRDGNARLRGFKGTYKITLGSGPKAVTCYTTLTQNSRAQLIY
jgi:GH35 family endo-1,4-beta-xylanase